MELFSLYEPFVAAQKLLGLLILYRKMGIKNRTVFYYSKGVYNFLTDKRYVRHELFKYVFWEIKEKSRSNNLQLKFVGE